MMKIESRLAQIGSQNDPQTVGRVWPIRPFTNSCSAAARGYGVSATE